MRLVVIGLGIFVLGLSLLMDVLVVYLFISSLEYDIWTVLFAGAFGIMVFVGIKITGVGMILESRHL